MAPPVSVMRTEPSVCTRVSYYRDWILSYIEPCEFFAETDLSLATWTPVTVEDTSGNSFINGSVPNSGGNPGSYIELDVHLVGGTNFMQAYLLQGAVHDPDGGLPLGRGDHS